MFEASVIEKHLKNTGQCPITGVDLSSGDLIALKVAGATPPKPLVANSVPSILTMLQTEWDAVMLDVFTLRKSLTDTRKELAHALYQ